MRFKESVLDIICKIEVITVILVFAFHLSACGNGGSPNDTPSGHTLSVIKAGAGAGTISSVPSGIDCGTDCTENYLEGAIVTLKASPLAGSTFTGWSGGGCSGTGTCTVAMDQVYTVTADFALNIYTIQASAGTGGNITPSGDVIVSYGKDQNFTITPDSSYVISNVLVNGSSQGAIGSYTFNNVTDNQTIEAQFSLIQASDWTLLVDFGVTEADNQYEISGWNTAISDYATYRSEGPGGISGGTSANWSSFGVQGQPRTFTEREKIVITWYNNYDKEQVIIPRLSFNDPDRPIGGQTGVWYGMSKTRIPAYGTAVSVFEFDKNSQGEYSLINVNALEADTEDRYAELICDKIELEDGTLDIDSLISYPRQTRTITAHVVSGDGTITPSDEWGKLVDVQKGENITFAITPGPQATNYEVFVDAENVTDQVQANGNTYTFNNVQKDHAIAVSFYDNTQPIYTINVTHGINGTVSPTGVVTVNEGAQARIKYTPIFDYRRDQVLLDGIEPVGVDYWNHVARPEGYLFKEGVYQDHTLHVNFSYWVTRNYKTLEHLNLWEQGSEIPNGTINPDQIQYLGAFRGPETNEDEWQYMNGAITYYPDGDGSSTDYYPGSLYIVGNRSAGSRSPIMEISIPEPVNSKNINELNQAQALQPFTKVDTGLDDEVIRGLSYISTSDRFYFGQGKGSYWDDARPSVGSFVPDMSNPQTQGTWHLGGMGETGVNYFAIEPGALDDKLSAGDHGRTMFEIPQAWADQYTGGKTLLTGRSTARIGSMHLYAIAPWDESSVAPEDWDSNAQAPVYDGKVKYTRLLEYQNTDGKAGEGYGWSDSWIGGAWFEDGNNQALVFSTIDGYGNIFYNNGSGRVNCNENAKVVLKFFNPDDLAAVVQDDMEVYEPKPYANLNITPYLMHDYFGEELTPNRSDEAVVIGMAYDKVRNFIYISELEVYGGSDGNVYPVFHVFKLGEAPVGP